MSESNGWNLNRGGVLADGCFDPLHMGHVRYLLTARALCFYDVALHAHERLVVRIAPDLAITMKGRACFQTAAERADVIAALVPCECAFDDTLAEAVRRLQPRLLVKGLDWYGKLPLDVIDACMEVKTQIVHTTTVARSSTERLTV